MNLYRRLLTAAIVLAVVVIGLGAYVRLSDAGLGCPDWPGCYGHWLGVPEAGHEQQVASRVFPGRPVDTGKAWKEMVHRYAAGTLGLLVLALCLLAWRPALRHRQSPLPATLLLGLIVAQAALGMWTVTLLLKPLIVTLHLLGGMLTLAGLVALRLAVRTQPAPPTVDWRLRAMARVALLAVLIQIALGGWVSSNYAGLACLDFPLCQGAWLPAMDWRSALTLHRELGQTATGDALPFAALTTIHWLHRLGALLVTGAVLALASRLHRLHTAGEPRWHLGLLLVLGLQIGLGLANVLLSLPLPLAVAHTLGAASLLTLVVVIVSRCRQASDAAAAKGERSAAVTCA